MDGLVAASSTSQQTASVMHWPTPWCLSTDASCRLGNEIHLTRRDGVAREESYSTSRLMPTLARLPGRVRWTLFAALLRSTRTPHAWAAMLAASPIGRSLANWTRRGKREARWFRRRSGDRQRLGSTDGDRVNLLAGRSSCTQGSAGGPTRLTSAQGVHVAKSRGSVDR